MSLHVLLSDFTGVYSLTSIIDAFTPFVKGKEENSHLHIQDAFAILPNERIVHMNTPQEGDFSMFIFFIRHGLTDWNAMRRFQGTCDIPLNETGIRQAQAAAERCKQLRIERVYHSCLQRAAKTAEIVAEGSGAPLIPCPGFNEVCMGRFQGLTLPEAQEKYPAESAAYFGDQMHVAPPEGESMLDLQVRALHALETVEKDAEGCQRIAIVSHGALLKVLMSKIIELPITSFGLFDISNGSISVIESINGKRRLITLNDISHFADPYASMGATRLMI